MTASFSLEKAVAGWLKRLARSGALAEGKIAELESHLREEIEEGLAEGLPESEAFRLAAERMGRPEDILGSFGLARLRSVGRSHWTALRLFPALGINNLRLALRRFRRRKGYSLISVLPLAGGLAAAGLILLFIRFEAGMDSRYGDVDRIYRVGLYSKSAAGESVIGGNYSPLAAALREQFAQVEIAAEVMDGRGFEPVPVKYGDKVFREDHLLQAGPELFSLLGIRFLRGDPASALDRSGTCVISRRMAAKYFGGDDPIGKRLDINNRDYEVTGITVDPARDSQIQHDFVTSWKTFLEDERFQGWHPGITAVMTLVKLKPGVDPAAFEKAIADLPHRYAGEELKSLDAVQRLILQPIRKVYLYDFTPQGPKPNSRLIYLYILGLIAGLILLLAGLNFVNLATARSVQRAGEVGVRKVIGASRRQLIGQFLGESLLIAGMALAMAWTAMAVLLPFFNSLTLRSFEVSDLARPGLLASFLGLTLLLGLAAGVYPALVLSSFRPGIVLKGRLRAGFKGGGLRRTLVVGQFSISIILIIGTLFVGRQVDFMRRQPLGFDKEQKLVVTLRDWRMITDRVESVKSEFALIPGVLDVATGSGVPGRGINQTFVFPTGERETKGKGFLSLRCDADFFRVFDLKFAAGRPFRKDIASDVYDAYILNEEGVKAFGWSSPEEALGKTIGDTPRPIVGIVRDFHWWGLQQPIEPMVIRQAPDLFRYIILKIDVSRLPELRPRIKEAFHRLFPGDIFETFFVDEAFDLQYDTEKRIERLFGAFMIVALFIGCLGLFGLAAFVSEQRTKEIGVRKVVGASVGRIIGLLTKEFGLWVLLANILAWPPAYLAGRAWLRGFPIAMAVPWDVFLLAGGLALALALATVGLQAYRAAVAPPVESLRYE
jgi:putative ABC transport system permease protein